MSERAAREPAERGTQANHFPWNNLLMLLLNGIFVAGFEDILGTQAVGAELILLQEKRGLRELRVLENLKKTILETNEDSLPKCEQSMHDNLSEVLQRLQAANDMIHKLQEKEHEKRKIQADKLMAGEEKRVAQREMFLQEQQSKREEVDEEHRKAMERLKEQYSEMEKELAKYVSF